MTNLALAVLAATNESKKSGPIALAVILILCVVCYFLFKSMSKHMRKVREEFPGVRQAEDDNTVVLEEADSDEPDVVTHPADQPPAGGAEP